MWNNLSNLTNAVINSTANGIIHNINISINPVSAVVSEQLDASPTPAILNLIKGKPVRFSGVAWKRRSGLGKYSASAAWERRKFELIESILCYYGHGDSNGGVSGQAGEADDDTLSRTSSLNDLAAAEAVVAGGTEMTKTARANASTTPRGYLDLLKDEASVGASTGHSAAPTPFALSIKVLGQTKWKMCFDTHMDLMRWLAALTDVIVQGSVDGYNVQLLQAADPTQGGDNSGQLREPPMVDNDDNQSFDFGVHGGHRLWTTGEYKVHNCNEEQLKELEEYMNREEEARQKTSREEMELKQKQQELIQSQPAVEPAPAQIDGEKDVSGGAANDTSPSASESTGEALDVVTEGERNNIDASESDSIPPRVLYGFPNDQLTFVAVLFNAALIAARSSVTSVEMFWALVTATNMAFFRLLHKINFGGTAENSPTGKKMRKQIASEVRFIKNQICLNQKNTKVRFAPTSMDGVPEESNILSQENFKPHAGTTMIEMDDISGPPSRDGRVFVGWQASPPESVMVRSHGYNKTKQKVPSPGQLYKCVRADFFESAQRCPDIASRVILPKVDFRDYGPRTWNAPDVFVVSISIPTDQPSLTSTSTDGSGFTIAMYFVMCDDTREILRRVTADGYNPAQEEINDVQKSRVNAVRLFDDWCRRAPNDDTYMARFKFVPDAQNLDAIGVPSWISKYNAKPFLIKRPGQTGFLYRHPERSCMEFDISLHPFPFIAKKGICFMKDTFFKNVIVTFAFVIEGRSDDELPECIIGLMKLCYPDPQHAIQGQDLFAGTSRRSFDPDTAKNNSAETSN